ncbi:MAG: hypothetical protein FJZ56_00360 [Chlamydiae bacterium]|nr:hypothetical protein [Chlamydiota bacterium]
MKNLISIFGVAEHGSLYEHISVKCLNDLLLTLGQPQDGSLAIEIAIQSLLYEREVLFYRVQEEGYESDAYLKGLYSLKNKSGSLLPSAIALPGVSSQEIIDEAVMICKKQSSFLIMNQKDLYDFLTR